MNPVDPTIKATKNFLIVSFGLTAALVALYAASVFTDIVPSNISSTCLYGSIGMGTLTLILAMAYYVKQRSGSRAEGSDVPSSQTRRATPTVQRPILSAPNRPSASGGSHFLRASTIAEIESLEQWVTRMFSELEPLKTTKVSSDLGLLKDELVKISSGLQSLRLIVKDPDLQTGGLQENLRGLQENLKEEYIKLDSIQAEIDRLKRGGLISEEPLSPDTTLTASSPEESEESEEPVGPTEERLQYLIHQFNESRKHNERARLQSVIDKSGTDPNEKRIAEKRIAKLNSIQEQIVRLAQLFGKNIQEILKARSSSLA